MLQILIKRLFSTAYAVGFSLVLMASPAVKPRTLNAQGYSHHVELTWENSRLFTYELYRSVDGGKRFAHVTETNDNHYNDFFTPKAYPQKVVYRIAPKGIDVNDPLLQESELTATLTKMNDDQLLEMVQRHTTRYFHQFAHPINGMARERSNDTNADIVTTGGTGFGVMALVAATERGYIDRDDFRVQLTKIVSFLERAERFQGAWAHWYNASTEKAFSFSRYDDGGDLVETAFLIQGLLTAAEYIKEGNSDERNLAYRIEQLWRGINWNWYTNGTNNLYWHWSKNWSFKMDHRIKGFDETLITYVLAASSPTYPIAPNVYHSCYTNSEYFKNGKTYFGIPLALGMDNGGPLFFTHYSFLGMNPNGLTDRYANYFDRNRAHVRIHQAYAIENPKKHIGYNEKVWGFTSSDDPIMGYTSHHPGTNDENGTVSPTAATSSLPYAPEIVLPTIRHFYEQLGAKIWGEYGFYDAFNLSMPEGQQVVHSYLAIDQGPIAVMIENFRSGLIWKLFAQNKDVSKGMKKLDFVYQNK